MRRHMAYLGYVVRHKWHVFWACLKLGVPIWLAIWHDISRFTPGEWFPYARWFYNPDGTERREIRDETGVYNPSRQLIEFQYAWLNHQRNKHHWQAWVIIDAVAIDPVQIPEIYVREMVADWIGAGIAQGKPDYREWYLANKGKMYLHQETRRRVEEILGV